MSESNGTDCHAKGSCHASLEALAIQTPTRFDSTEAALEALSGPGRWKRLRERERAETHSPTHRRVFFHVLPRGVVRVDTQPPTQSSMVNYSKLVACLGRGWLAKFDHPTWTRE